MKVSKQDYVILTILVIKHLKRFQLKEIEDSVKWYNDHNKIKCPGKVFIWTCFHNGLAKYKRPEKFKIYLDSHLNTALMQILKELEILYPCLSNLRKGK